MASRRHLPFKTSPTLCSFKSERRGVGSSNLLDTCAAYPPGVFVATWAMVGCPVAVLMFQLSVGAVTFLVTGSKSISPDAPLTLTELPARKAVTTPSHDDGMIGVAAPALTFLSPR